MKNPFKELTKTELILWLSSLALVLASFVFSKEKDVLAFLSSLIGVTALIFIAKGYVFGQILVVVFSVFYGVVSYFSRYYGEMITYLGMSAPIALATTISWFKHPYKQTKTVEIAKISGKQVLVLCVLTAFVTTAFYFILRALNTANLVVSTISIATSFFAASLTFLRSPYYGLAYAANDLVLIVLWILASLETPSLLPMIFCFIAFLINDVYGFINWKRLQKSQS